MLSFSSEVRKLTIELSNQINVRVLDHLTSCNAREKSCDYHMITKVH